MVSAFLDRSLATSPLLRLRKSKAQYVPSGNDGQDRLLLELLDHEFPVKQTCLFYRPTIQSLPHSLGVKLGLNQNRQKRQSLALQGYQSGRLQYTEILQRKTLWQLADLSPNGGFASYDKSINASDVIQQIDHFIFLVRTMPAYELIITDAFLPFYISTFEIIRPQQVEHFILFFQNCSEDSIREASTFGLRDDSVYFSTHEQVVRWVLSHPTTIRSRDQVITELEAIRTSILRTANSKTEDAG